MSGDSGRRQEALEALAAEFRRQGYDVAVDGDRIPYPPLGLQFRAASCEMSGGSKYRIVHTVFDAAAMDVESEGILVHAIGSGENAQEALADSAAQWALGVFPVLHSRFSDHEDKIGAHVMEIMVRADDSGEKFGWRAHLGPVIMRHSDPEGQDEPEHEALLKAMLGPVSGIAAHADLFWLESFAVLLPDGKVDADCRVDNREWEEGHRALLNWASDWPRTPGAYVSKRQFILFEPVPIGALKSGGKLASALPGVRKPWWKFWGK